MKRLAILGSTGSIGINTLAVVERFPERFSIQALAGAENVALLAEQVRKFSPELAVVIDESRAGQLRRLLPSDTKTTVLHGDKGYEAAAVLSSVDMVVSAMVGAAGLDPTVAAIRAGKNIALANKEVLVMAGRPVMDLAAAKGVDIIPVDSEHSAVFQCLQGHQRRCLARIHLTASGGPFLNKSRREIAAADPEAALAHPTWRMGRKISIDSATLMNKGLEVIEASFLFQVAADDIEVVIHPQSIVHSLVSFVDGSMLAQLGAPDMRGAIAYALSCPERVDAGLTTPDLAALGALTFQAPDWEKFPCLSLAFAAARAGGTAPAVLNAANEVAVAAFLDRRLSFYAMAEVIETVLEQHDTVSSPDLSEIKAADARARESARQIIKQQKTLNP